MRSVININSVAFDPTLTNEQNVIDNIVLLFFCLDLILSKNNKYYDSIDFLMEYQDQETFQKVRNH